MLIWVFFKDGKLMGLGNIKRWSFCSSIRLGVKVQY